MKCKYEHYGHCCNCGATQYMIECKQPCETIVPMTNAEQFREMTDEELCDWAKVQVGCGFGFFPCGVVCEGKCESFSDEECKAKIMNWLKQPAEGDVNNA